MTSEPMEHEALPLDPDVEGPGARKAERRSRRGDLVLVAAVGTGGVAGALARYLLLLAVPAATGHFPWGTFIINTSGSAILGFLLVLIIEQFPRGHLARPILGTGVLGAFTTFSTLAVETVGLARAGALPAAAADIFGSVAAGLLAVSGGMLVARLALRVERWLQSELP